MLTPLYSRGDWLCQESCKHRTDHMLSTDAMGTMFYVSQKTITFLYHGYLYQNCAEDLPKQMTSSEHCESMKTAILLQTLDKVVMKLPLQLLQL
ncbi:hypothetical protein PanWU01x14_067780 [Parasponia andersonii]|uniref:Uncharacterized protein n=1 Tax=Parasponia andersonii TaxID=3476 RepID=A0A2P5DF45_PARAD|nr:hypothetical protein PanWU01x14_067780 [Parasponia andersonii]